MLLTRSPLGVTRCCHQVVLARLACIKHAASVHPEPGSNSPSEIVNSHRHKCRQGCSRRSSATLEPPSLTIRPGRTGGMGDARAYPAPLKAHPLSGCAKEPFRGGKPPTGRGFGTGFSHTVEFSRNVAGLLFGDSPAVPASCHRRSGGTVPRAFQDRQRLPTCPVSVLLAEYRLPRRHLHTEVPPCARPSERQDGHRTAVGSDPLGVRRPPVFRCRRHWRRPERSSVSKNFPACSLEKVAPGSTPCQLDDARWT